MASMKDWLVRTRWILLLLTASMLVYACGSGAGTAPTATSAPAPSPTPEPTDSPEPTDEPEPTGEATIGTDIHVELPEGDLDQGQYKALILECDACHVRTPNMLSFESGEELPKILERGEMRIADPAYAGSASTNEEYIVESIVLPQAYIVHGWWHDDGMPADFGARMTKQDLADIFAWLATFE